LGGIDFDRRSCTAFGLAFGLGPYGLPIARPERKCRLLKGQAVGSTRAHGLFFLKPWEESHGFFVL
jgi:hypothetical protein